LPVPAQSDDPAPAIAPDELDAAIRETSDYLNKQLPKGNKLVILNFQSEYPALSEYVIDELIANTVNDRVFSVVDRQQLNTIRAELNFQMSDEVSDETAQSVRELTGAQIIVSGAVSRLGVLYRLRVRTLSVESARIEGQFNRNIPDGPTIAALVQSQATGYGGSNYSGNVAAAKPTADAAPAGAGQTAVPAPTTPASAPPPAEKVYKIGDTGPAGGIVFYTEGGGTSGMEASRLLGSYNWEEALKVAKSFDGGGKNDWRLPTADELNLVYENVHKAKVADFGKLTYWSSSTYGNYSYYQDFSNGSRSFDDRTDSYSARAVRNF
jgi:hypothetical protein